jgi:hypothetical protein
VLTGCHLFGRCIRLPCLLSYDLKPSDNEQFPAPRASAINQSHPSSLLSVDPFEAAAFEWFAYVFLKPAPPASASDPLSQAVAIKFALRQDLA